MDVASGFELDTLDDCCGRWVVRATAAAAAAAGSSGWGDEYPPPPFRCPCSCFMRATSAIRCPTDSAVAPRPPPTAGGDVCRYGVPSTTIAPWRATTAAVTDPSHMKRTSSTCIGLGTSQRARSTLAACASTGRRMCRIAASSARSRAWRAKWRARSRRRDRAPTSPPRCTSCWRFAVQIDDTCAAQRGRGGDGWGDIRGDGQGDRWGDSLGWQVGWQLGWHLGWRVGWQLGWQLRWHLRRWVGWQLRWRVGWHLRWQLGWQPRRQLGRQLRWHLRWQLGWQPGRQLRIYNLSIDY